jgi:glycosyltransferase involved in cell wall biosynthesis
MTRLELNDIIVTEFKYQYQLMSKQKNTRPIKLAIMTSCKNEAETLQELFDRMPKKIDGVDEVFRILIDDGSTDNTAEIGRKNGAIVHVNKTNKRLAYSFSKAVSIALENGADYAVFIDADLQFDPEQIPDIARPVIEQKADMVVGDRFTDVETGEKRRPKNMPVGKYLANRLGTYILSYISGAKFADVTCGFRAYNREALLAINIHNKYTYTQEAFQLLTMRRFDIQAFPINIYYFPGRVSRVVTSFTSFLFGSGINILRTFRDNAPLRFFGLLGGVTFGLGLILDVFTIIHYTTTGGFTPYVAVAFAGIYLNTIGIFLWIFGLLADMIGRLSVNQERMLELIKDIRYNQSN